jgi:hypothetical protein
MFEYIVLSGGGPRVFSFCGALEQMISVMNKKYQTQNWLNEYVKGGGGTSIGAFVVFAVLSGCPVVRLFHMVKEARLWRGEHMLANVDWMNIQETGGICKHDLLFELVYQTMDELDIDREITFQQWNQKFGKELVMNATCAEDHRVKYFSHRWTPHIRICEALVMSMCLPGLFQPYVFRGKSYVDGGVACNYIAHLFPPESTIGISHFNSKYTTNKLLEPKSILDDVTPDIELEYVDIINPNRNIVSTVLDMMDGMCWYLQAEQFTKMSQTIQQNTICIFPLHIVTYNSITMLDYQKMDRMYIYGSMKTLWHFYGDSWSIVLVAQLVENLFYYAKEYGQTS